MSRAQGVSLTQLKDVVPLDTPLSVLIDPSNVCNFKCTFCPTGSPQLLKAVKRPAGVMKFELFTKIIDDLKEFPGKIRALLMYKDGEPLINKSLARMIRYAKTSNVAEGISTTSNGALLTRERSIDLIESGLDTIRISVEHVHNKGYREITKTFEDYDLVRRNIAFLFEEKRKRGSSLLVIAKIVDVGLSPEEKETFFADFQPITDAVYINALMGWSNTGNEDMLLGAKPTTGPDGETPLKPDRRVCPSPFKTMAVNFNGQVSVCCVDWSMDTIVGDVNRQSLCSIWNGEAMRRFRLVHLRGERNQLKACNECQYVAGMDEASDLDSVAGALLGVLEDPESGRGSVRTLR